MGRICGPLKYYFSIDYCNLIRISKNYIPIKFDTRHPNHSNLSEKQLNSTDEIHQHHALVIPSIIQLDSQYLNAHDILIDRSSLMRFYFEQFKFMSSQEMLKYTSQCEEYRPFLGHSLRVTASGQPTDDITIAPIIKPFHLIHRFVFSRH